MLKLHKNLNKRKTQLTGRFKLPFSLNGDLENKSKWVDEKETEKVENLIGYLFTQYHREVEKRRVKIGFADDPLALVCNECQY